LCNQAFFYPPLFIFLDVAKEQGNVLHIVFVAVNGCSLSGHNHLGPVEHARLVAYGWNVVGCSVASGVSVVRKDSEYFPSNIGCTGNISGFFRPDTARSINPF